jgi:hypothetical protein
VAVAALAWSTPTATADVVYLVNGQAVEGRVVESPGSVRVELEFGRLTFDRREVLRIERKPLLQDVYEERVRALDRRDPQAARALARWCEQQRLVDEAAALHEHARQAELTLRLEATDPTDAEALLALHAWAREQGYPAATLREVLGMVTAVAPDHDEARELLGHERFRGEWRATADVEAILSEEEAIAMRERGFVEWGGAWMRPEEARLKQAEVELQLARESLARESAALAKERAELGRLRAQVEERLLALEASQKELEALRAELTQERLALADTIARGRYAASVPIIVTTRRRPSPPAPRAEPAPPARSPRPQGERAGGARVRIGR